MSTFRTLVVLAAVAVAAAPADATTPCLDWVEDIHNTSSDCTTTPNIPRYLMSHLIEWGGTTYYVVDDGNELEFYDVGASPADPIRRHDTFFNVPNQGDSDYDLTSFSVCDGCRFGSASYKLGLVVFDTGTGTFPDTSAKTFYPGLPFGAFTFSSRGSEYLITKGLLDSCDGNGSSVYKILPAGNSVALSRVACARLPGDLEFQPAGGVSMEVAGEQYLYLAKTTSLISVFRVVPNGNSIALEHVDTGNDPRLRAAMRFGKGMSYDPDRNLLATAYTTRGLTLWDVADPADPRVVWSDPAIPAARVAIRGRFLHATGPFLEDVWSFEIADPSAPAPVDPAFWDLTPANSWNDNCSNGTNYDAVFHPTEEILYAARYARDQVIDYGACGAGLLAGLRVASDPPLHNQAITLENTSILPPGAPVTFDWDVLDAGGSALVDELTACDGPGTADDDCQVPPHTLQPDVRYRFQVRATVTGTGDTSYTFAEAVVEFGGPDLGVSAVPQNPDIGEMVVFTLTGTTSVDQVTWSFGAPGCPPFQSGSICIPSQFDSCLSAPFIYAVAGPATASAVVRIGGVDFGPYEVQVDVADAGTCACLVPPPVWQVSSLPAQPAVDVETDLQGWQIAGGTTAGARWRIERRGRVVASADSTGLQHTFDLPGLHRAVFEAWNCAGTDRHELDLAVMPVPELDYAVGVAHAAHTTPRAAAALGDTLLVGTSGSPSGGGLFRRLAGGVLWQAVVTGGFGDAANTAVSALVAFGGSAWAGTENDAAGAQLWTSADGASWSPVTGGGFGDPANVEIAALAVHDGALYAATRSSTGVEVWRSADGTTGWTQVNLDGFGSSANQAPGGLASSGGRLYATVEGEHGAEVWRYLSGTTWEQVGGDGFGDAANEAAPALASQDGLLWAGTRNPTAGAEMWRSADGDAWERAAAGGFGDPSSNGAVCSVGSRDETVWAGTDSPAGGAEVWASEDGGFWYPWLVDGLGDPANAAATAMVILDEGLFAAVENAAGFRVWRTDLPSPDLFGDGFETGDAAAWSDAVGD